MNSTARGFLQECVVDQKTSGAMRATVWCNTDYSTNALKPKSWQHTRIPVDAFSLGETDGRLSVMVSGCDQPVYALSFR